jgi:hypothetical protein
VAEWDCHKKSSTGRRNSGVCKGREMILKVVGDVEDELKKMARALQSHLFVD